MGGFSMSETQFVCPTCGKKISKDLQEILRHAESEIIEEIKKEHKDWIDKDGICDKCYLYYKSQLKNK